MKFLLRLRPLLLVVVFTFFLVAIPGDFALAQTDPETSRFVTCNGPDCSLCNLVDMGNTLIIWLFGIIFIIFAVIMFIAGIGLVTSGGNQSALDEAKKKFQNALIGILIIMAAWLVVDRIMTTLLADGAGSTTGVGPWNEVECQVQATPQPWSRTGQDGLGDGVVTPPATTSGTASHQAAVDALGDGFVISSSGNCSDRTRTNCTSLDGVRDLTVTRIGEFQDAVGETLVITGGTEAGHAAGQYSHANGYKIDVRPSDQVNSYIQSNYTSIGNSRWRDPRGNVYYRHGPPDHWDISVTN